MFFLVHSIVLLFFSHVGMTLNHLFHITTGQCILFRNSDLRARTVQRNVEHYSVCWVVVLLATSTSHVAMLGVFQNGQLERRNTESYSVFRGTVWAPW